MPVIRNNHDTRILEHLKSDYYNDLCVLKEMIPMFRVSKDVEQIMTMGLSMISSIAEDIEKAKTLEDLGSTFDLDGLRKNMDLLVARRSQIYDGDTEHEIDYLMEKHGISEEMADEWRDM